MMNRSTITTPPINPVPEYACRKDKPAKNRINGILLVNKPEGLTSNAVLQRVKHQLHAKKAGHTGSLDPLATGMLPICFGEATKFSQYLLDADKCYTVTGVLGVKTDSSDATGEVIAQCDVGHISTAQLQAVLTQFLGLIEQVPSMFSALKYQGKPLYHYARAGITIQRPARQVHIRKLQLEHFDGRAFRLTVTCSKGTYIRNLVEDIGDCLGVGAHVAQLHRCFTAGFDNEPMYTLETLSSLSLNQLQACLLPIERAVNGLPMVQLSSAAIDELQYGRCVKQAVSASTGDVRLYADGEFFGLGELTLDGELKAKRLLAF